MADRLGHEKITTTLQTYSHLYPDKNRELADKLEEFVSESEKYNAKEMYNARKT